MTNAAPPPVDESNLAAAFAPDLDSLLAPRREGWLGADVALSLTLPDGRILWVFGDTLVGRLRDGRREVVGMPRNSIAIQVAPSTDPATVKFIYDGPDGAPRSFLRLPESEPEEHWFWATAGIVIEGELFIIGYSVAKWRGECEALEFRLLDTWLMRVRDTSGPPPGWRIEAARLPFAPGAPWFGASAYAHDDGHVYLMGLRRKNEPARGFEAVLARAGAADLLRRGAETAFEFWGGNDAGQSGWANNPLACRALFEPGVAECTILWDAPRGRFVATTYQPGRPEYLITSAPALTGPWSAPVPVWRPDEHQPLDAYLYYAFRLHPHLAASPDEMPATFVVNPKQVAGLDGDLTVYYPRFLRLDLARV